MTIALCIISGNEAAHIERMLTSFAPAFDQLSFVRAIGAAKPDETWQLAEAWCVSRGKRFIGAEYRNAPGCAFEHVDDYAAARNLAFGNADGADWLLWADCDDVCDDAAAIRSALAATKADLLRFPYDVPQSGKQTMRERAIRAELFRAGRRWMWPVHENLVPWSGDKIEEHTAPRWIHDPVGPKAGGERRNLRILTQALRDAPAYYYYCHQENYYLRKREESRRFGQIFLSLPGSPPTLRYQCLLNMAELAAEQEEAATYALRAHHLFPEQKEAIACLVKCAFQEESPDRAAHWSRLLFFAPNLAPEKRLWCYEPKWDGWGKYDLRARALRLAGYDALGDKTEAQMRQGNPPTFSLLHATRGRVNRAIQARDLWLDTAAHPESVEHIFAIDDDDAESARWLKSYKRVVNSTRTCVAAWNDAAAMSEGGILVQVSDDFIPPRGWDAALLAAIGNRNPNAEQFAVHVGDGTRTDQLMCMAVISRARWEAQGRELFSPEYESMFSDNELSFRAYRDGIVIDARHLVFQHLHPAFGKGQMDETYARQNAPEKYARGEATFKRRNPDAL